MLAGVKLRRLTRADAAEYHIFRQKQLEANPTAFTSMAAEESEKPVSWAADRISNPDRPNDVIFGAFDQAGCLIGIAGLAVPEQQQARHKATLFGMAVAVEAAGQGVGRALVERVLDEAKQLGLLQVVLTYSEGNASAERLYRSCGFIQFGREPRAVIVDEMPVTKIHMVCILDGYVPHAKWFERD